MFLTAILQVNRTSLVAALSFVSNADSGKGMFRIFR